MNAADDKRKDVLPLVGYQLPEIDFEEALGALEAKTCDRFWDVYRSLTKSAAEEGKDVESRLFDSLQLLCSFRPNYHERAEPYRPMMIVDGQRSPIPDDLSSADLDLVAQFYQRSQDPALRARLGDVLFLRRRDHKAALDAVGNYVAAANNLVSKAGWLDAPQLFKRALQLAGNLGREKDAWNGAANAILATMEHPLAQSEKFYVYKLLEVAIGMGIGDPAVLTKLAREQAERATVEKDFRRVRMYRILEADFLSFAKQSDEEAKVRLLIAEAYVDEGEQALLRTVPSYSVAGHFLARGVEALRQAKGDPTRILELRQRLRDYQSKSMDQMQPLEVELDLTELAGKAKEFVRSRGLEEAIERLALGFSVLSVKELREEVLENAKMAPLSHILGTDIVNQHGQVQKSTGALLGAKGQEAENELESRMFQAAARSSWPCRSVGFIQPARSQIWLDHAITPPDLAYIVRHNPFVPPGHEAIFMRGLFYGFSGDMMLAAHLLVPQIENSIRYVLMCNGVDVSNLNSDMTQPVKLFGPLLDLPETKEIFGEDLMFEFRGLLIEKTGYGFRNNLAHGFITEQESYGYAAVNCWWLVLRLCLMSLKILEDRQRKGIE